jgi:hypothetical protein
VGSTVTGPLRAVRLTFNTAIDPSTFTLSAVRVVGPTGAAVSVASVTAVPGSGSTQFDVTFSAAQSARGKYTLTVGPSVRNVRGTAMDQNNNTAPGEATDPFALAFTIA